MSIIARDPHFSWASPLTGDDASEKTTHTSSSHSSHVPQSKQIERRIVNIWKTLTRSTRKQKRVSVYAKDFVFVTAAASRRRSIMMASQHLSDAHSRPHQCSRTSCIPNV
ncbi:hypothetical protein AN958_08881 [Leucoagaricus sp. SymC.cos]|nr:hypothetical protein AN958_08881 [Leucoagaricus sp. SymC.cos]